MNFKHPKGFFISLLIFGFALFQLTSQEITIVNLADSDEIAGPYIINGSVSGIPDAAYVGIQINDGPWVRADGIENWNYTIDSRHLVIKSNFRYNPVSRIFETVYTRGIYYGQVPVHIAVFDENNRSLAHNSATITIKPEKPRADKITGYYSDDVILNLTAQPDLVIYYTDNGDDPRYAGTEYRDGLTLTETKKVRIVSYNKNYDIYSDELVLDINIDRTGPPAFTVQYYSDQACTIPFENSPYLKEGTYYLKITATKLLSENPLVTIDSEGSVNDISVPARAEFLEDKVYILKRHIARDNASGKVRETIKISGTDLLGQSSVAVSPENSGEQSAFIDLTPPSAGTISVRGVAGTTSSSTPVLDIRSDGADFMRLALSREALASSEWIAYKPVYQGLNIAAAGDGQKEIWIEFKDKAGNVQPVQARTTTWYDSTVLSFDVEYCTDQELIEQMGHDPYLKEGRYYLKIKANRELPEIPVITIDAEGSVNDITGREVTRIDANSFYLVRDIAADPLALGLEREQITISSLTPANGEANAAFTDTKKPSLGTISNVEWTNKAASITIDASDNTEDLTFQWQKIQGEGTLLFSHENGPATSIEGIEGEEVEFGVRVTVTDRAGNVEVEDFLFKWDKKAPVVNAGSDINWTNSSVLIDASVAEQNSPVTYTWSKISGTGSVTFGTPGAEDTTVTGADGEEGIYELQLTAVDPAGNSASDTLIFKWDKKAPVVNAGDDIEWTNSAANLTPRVTDLNPALVYLWEKTAGEGTVTFGKAGLKETTVSGTDNEEQVFTLKLTVTDGVGNTASDTLLFNWDKKGPEISAPEATLYTNKPASFQPEVNDTNPIASVKWEQVFNYKGMQIEDFESGVISDAFSFSPASDFFITDERDKYGKYSLSSTDIRYGQEKILEMTVEVPANGKVTFYKMPRVFNGLISCYFYIDDDLQNIMSLYRGWGENSYPVTAGTRTFKWRIKNNSSTPNRIYFDNIRFPGYEKNLHMVNPSDINTLFSGPDLPIEQEYTLKLTGTDSCGNTSSKIFTLKWDKKPPLVEAGSGSATQIEDDSTYIYDASAYDKNSVTVLWEKTAGAGEIFFSAADKERTYVWGEDYVRGTYTLQLTATDRAGNSASDSRILKWDKTPAMEVNNGMYTIIKSLDFGYKDLTSSSIKRTFEIENTGLVDLTIEGITCTDRVNYSISDLGDPVIKKGNHTEREITVTFHPRTAGPKNAQIIIKSDDPDNRTYTIDLTGVGIDAIPLTLNSWTAGRINADGDEVWYSFSPPISDKYSVHLDGGREGSGGYTSLASLSVYSNGNSSPFLTGDTALYKNPQVTRLYQKPKKLFCVKGTAGTFALRVGREPDLVIKEGNRGSVSINHNHTFDFGLVGTGDSKKQTYTIANEGLSILKNESVTINGTANFDLDRPSHLVVYPGSDTSFTVSFNPLTPGTHQASVTIKTNDPDEGTFVINFKGEGLEAEQISSLDTWVDGEISAEGEEKWYYFNGTAGQKVALFGDGKDDGEAKTLPLKVSLYNSDFSLEEARSGTLKTLPMTYTFSQTGRVYIKVQGGVSSDIGTYGLQLSNKGHMVLKDHDLMTINDGAVLEMGTLIFNKDESEKKVTLYNNGVGDLKIWYVTPSDTDNFTSTLSISSYHSRITLAPGEEKEFTVKFHPVSAGEKTMQLTIESNDLHTHLYTLNFKGRAMPSRKIETFDRWYQVECGEFNDESHNSYYFNFDATADEEYYIRWDNGHEGSGSHTALNSIKITGSDYNRIYNNFQDAGYTAPVKIKALETGPIYIYSKGGSPDKTFAIQVYQVPKLEVRAGGILTAHKAVCYLGLVPTGYTGKKTISISNAGAADLKLTGTQPVEISGPDADLFSVETGDLQTTIGRAGSSDFTILFSPRTAGPKRATLTIKTNDPVNPFYTINLTGASKTVDLSGSVVWRGYEYSGLAGVFNPATGLVEWKGYDDQGTAGVYNPQTGHIEWRGYANVGLAGFFNPATGLVEWKGYADQGLAGVFNPATGRIEWRGYEDKGFAGVYNPVTGRVEWKGSESEGFAGVYNFATGQVEWRGYEGKGVAGVFVPNSPEDYFYYLQTNGIY